MESILAERPTPQFAPEPEIMPRTQPTLMELALDQVEADPQVRKTFDPEAIEALAESLKASGQIVSILAYHDEARGKYIIIDGERRYRAATHARLGRIRAEVWGYKPTPEEIAAYQVAIDYHREGLDPIEQAAAFRQVMQANGWSANELARQIQVAQTTVSRALSLLELPGELQGLIKAGELNVAVARELARVDDPEARRAAWSRIRAEGMTAKQAAALVSKLLKPKAKSMARPTRPKSRYSYRNLSGFDASVSPRKIVLTATKNGRTAVEMLAALRTLVERLEQDVARAGVGGKADAGATPATASIPGDGSRQPQP